MRIESIEGSLRIFIEDHGSGIPVEIADSLGKTLKCAEFDVFSVVSQRIVRLADESIVGYELLSRSSVAGFENPNDFFRVCLERNMLTLVDLACLRNAVAAADDSISGIEEEQVRQISKELGFGDREYVHVRSAYNDKREVVKMMRAQTKA